MKLTREETLVMASSLELFIHLSRGNMQELYSFAEKQGLKYGPKFLLALEDMIGAIKQTDIDESSEQAKIAWNVLQELRFKLALDEV